MGMILSRGKMPPQRDGAHFHFEIEPGVLLKAATEEKLMAAIFEWRTRRGLPIGDLEEEINSYYCTRWPSACHSDPTKTVPRRTPLLHRVTQWAAMLASRMPRGGYSLVTQDEANRRAQICQVCPKNVAWRGGCVGCSQTTSILLAQLRQLRTSHRQGNLLACSITGADNLTAVHLPLETWVDTPEQKAQMPDACWRK